MTANPNPNPNPNPNATLQMGQGCSSAIAAPAMWGVETSLTKGQADWIVSPGYGVSSLSGVYFRYLSQVIAPGLGLKS